MGTKKTVKLKVDPAVSDTAELARSIFSRVRQIKHDHPEVAARVDRSETQIKKLLVQISDDISSLDAHDRDLVSIMIINGLQKAAEETLADAENLGSH